MNWFKFNKIVATALGLVPLFLWAQSQDSATYVHGTLGVQKVAPVNSNSAASCADTLSVSIPSGHWISGVDLYYSVQGTSGFGPFGTAPADVGAYLELESEGLKEAGLTYGSVNTNGATENMSRLGITAFNGAVTDSFLVFKLHAFIQQFQTACDTNDARVLDSTWKVVVHHYPAPTCYQPSDLAVEWIMSNKAKLSWTTGGAAAWQIEYGPTGFTPGSGTLLAAPTNPFVVTGLSASTEYDFYVRDSCGQGDVSLWSLPVTNSTLCSPISFTGSYVENFDGTAWTEGSGATNSGSTIDGCWERNPTSPSGGQGYAFGTGTGSTPTNNTGPDDDRTGNGNYIYAEASGAQNQSAAVIISPLMDLTDLTLPELNFWYHMTGDQVNELKTEVWSQSLGWVLMGSLNGEQQLATTDTFQLQIYTLSQFVDDTVRVRFTASRGFGTANEGDIALDDFGFEEAPTCPDPAQLAVQGRTTSSITLGWTAANATSWDIEYGAAGSALGATGNTTVSVSTNPYTVTGLAAGTEYDFWVREVCSSSDQSAWVGPITGTTHCSAVMAPWSEDFDSTSWTAGTGTYNSGSELAGCWLATPEAQQVAAGPYSWGVRSGTTTTGLTGPSADVSGSGNYVYAEASMGAPDQVGFLESPLLALDSLAKPRVQFYYYMWGVFVNELKLQVWVDSTSSWQTYWTAQGNQGNLWQFAEVDLSGFAGDTIVLRWAAKKGNGSQGDIAIDEVVVDSAPLCPEPTQFAVTGVGLNSATFQWLTGGSNAWSLTVGTTGFTPSGQNLMNTAATNATWTGLSAGTTYDAYVRDTCGVLGASDWVGPLTFTTRCAPVSAPWTEDFDSTQWVTGANQQPGQIDGCWVRTDSTGYFFKSGPPTNHSTGTGPSGDHTSGTGGYLFTEANTGFGGGNSLITSIESPFVDVSGLTAPELTFWYHMYGGLINKLEVYVREYSGSWSKIQTVTGAQQSAAADAWKESILDLSSYSGDTVQVKFTAYRYQGGQNQVDISIDDVDIHEAPDCPKPSNFAAGTPGSSSVDLSWTTGGSSAWQLEYGAPGHAVGSGTYVGTGSEPYTLTGLSANTAYEVWVRDSCGNGDVSEWVGPISFTTACGMATAPWTEDFEGASFDAGTGDLDPCFTASASTTYYFRTESGPTQTNNTGPSADHTSGSGSYVYAESGFGFNADTEAELETYSIDLDTLSTPELRFWWHGAGSNINDLEVEVWDGSSWTSELVVNSTNNTLQSAPTSPWQESVVDLSGYAGDTVKIRFTAARSITNGFQAQLADWAIDDLSIDNAPTCLKPSALASTASATSSVTLSWTTGGATQWQIEYGPVGFTPGSGTVVAASSNPFTVSGLSSSTSYDFYVRDSCSASDLSQWAGPLTASTSCGTAVAPYLENFEVGFVGGTDNGQGHNIGATISACWSRTTTDADSNYMWGGRSGATATAGTGPGGDHTSGAGSYVYAEASFSTGTPSAALYSPEIDLSALTVPQLKFWYHIFAQNGSQGTLVWSVKDVNGGSWTPIDSVSGTQGNQWIEATAVLSSFAGKTVQLKFEATKSSGSTAQQGDIAIDDVSIQEAPSCPDPSGLAATPVGANAVQLSWTTGGSAAWQIEYGPAGFAKGSGIVVQSVTNPHIVSGLSSGTAYDFYLRDSCGVADFSDWIGPISATTFTCANGCVYTLKLTDTFGDGWVAGGFGGNSHELQVTTGTTTTAYTFSNGSSQTFTLNVCNGDTLILEFVDGGQWESECGYELTDASGTVISSVAGAANANQPGAMTAGIKYSGSSSCTPFCPAPTADFAYTRQALTLDVDASTSTGAGLTYTWDFGDATSPNTITSPTASHTYASGGTYYVALTVTDSCGQTATHQDTVQACPALIPAVSYTQNTFNFTFDASATPGATQVNWDFGNGNSGIGSTISHTYTNGGNYQVTATFQNACGEQADTTFTISICNAPTANFTATILSQSGGGLTVQFDGTSSTGGTSYLWNFGDGNTNNTTNFPVHTYSVPTTAYAVTLTVFNLCGDQTSITKSLGEAINDVGLETFTTLQFGIHPNPTRHTATVTFPGGVDGQLEVHDLLGRTLSRHTLQGAPELTLDVANYPAGTYIIHVTAGTTMGTQRLIVE